MSIICSQCSHINPDNSGFCISCGNKLAQTGTYSATSISSSLPTYVSPASAPAAPSGPILPSYSSPSNPTFPPPFSPSPTPPSTSPPQWSATSLPPPPPGTQIGTAQGLGSIRRAFAGYGTLVMHHSWLLTGDHAQALAVRNAIREKIQQRGVVKLNVFPSTLTERGILMEEREYLIAHRGISTVFIYVAPAGQDLYISRATTVLPAISNVRIAIHSLLFVIMFFGFFSRPDLSTYLTGGAIAFLFAITLSVLSGPILLYFIVLLILSFIHWLKEKDFWRYLRPNILNDFNLDDLMLLEHMTDDTVKVAVTQVGLDATKIVPPALGYQPKQKIRAV